MTEDQERELRIKCIDLAHISMMGNSDNDIVEVAQNYYWFITAKDKEEK